MQMKMNSALAAALLGGGALLTTASANAADLPSRKAAPADYVRICDAYGPGFFVIPGTDTCGRFTQNLQANYYVIPSGNMLLIGQNGPGYNTGPSGVGAGAIVSYDPGKNGQKNTGFQNAATVDTTGFQSDNRMGMDTRTPTAFGTLRTAIGLRFKYESGVMSGSGLVPGKQGVSVTGEGSSENKIAVDKAYIQFMGFTAGFLASPFDFYYEDDDQTELQEPHGSVVQLNYTGILGNGLSFLIGVDNPGFHIDKGYGYLTPNAAGLDTNPNHLGVAPTLGRIVFPDIDMNIRWDQPWGSAILAGLIHPIDYLATNAGSAFFGPNAGAPSVNVSTVGFAVLGGLKFNLPMLAEGDQLWLQGIYSNGAMEAAGIGGNQGQIGQGSQATLLPGLLRNDFDAIMVANNDGSFSLEKEQAVSLLSAFHHWFIPDHLRGNLFAGYIMVTPGQQARTTDWLKGGISAASSLKLGANLIWSPIKGLEFTVEGMHTNLWQKLTADPGAAPSCTPGGPAASAAICGQLMSNIRINPSNWAGIFQAKRTF